MLEEGVRKAGGERGCDLWGQKADFTFCVTDVVERLESFFATTTTAAADSYNSKYTWKTVRRGWKCVETFPWEEVKCSRLSLERRPIMVLNTRAPGFFFLTHRFLFLIKVNQQQTTFFEENIAALHILLPHYHEWIHAFNVGGDDDDTIVFTRDNL